MKSIEQCLDMVLNDLATNWDKPDNKRDSLNATELLERFELPQNMQKHEFFKRLINRLIKDGYADYTDWQYDRIDLAHYERESIITIEGYLFLTQDGGYSKQKADRLQAIQNENDQNQRTERNELSLIDWTRILAVRTDSLMKWTRAVAVGAIGLVVWEVIAFGIEHHWFGCH